MSANRYKKLFKSKKRKRIPGIDFHIAQLRAQLDPIENARVDYKLMRQGFSPLDLSTYRPLDPSTS